MPAPWDADPPGADGILRERLAALALEMLEEAPSRLMPTAAMAVDWHRRLFEGIPPIDYYAGNVRDSDPALPELDGYNVMVGDRLGLPAEAVPAALTAFEERVQRATAVLDGVVAPGGAPRTTADLDGVITLCAQAHGSWVRIHPFANGNGRTARLWARWLGLRYGLPGFIRLMPRPLGDLYAGAARRSMDGDDGPTIRLFHTLLDIALGRPGQR